MCSACSFVTLTMQPAMTAADLLAQWMSSASHNTQASAPFLPTFSQTPQQHYPAGHTLPQSMQPQCTTAAFTQPFAPTPQQQPQQLMGHTVPQPTQAPFANSAFTQPPSFHAFNTRHHSTAMPGLQPPPHYNAAIPNPQLSPPQYGSFVTYQPTPQSTSTTLVQPLPATPVSQQFPTTTTPTPPMSHNKHSRTRSRTTRKKHRSTTRRRRRHRSTNRHCSRHRSRHRSTTPRSRHHKSQHRSRRRHQRTVHMAGDIIQTLADPNPTIDHIPNTDQQHLLGNTHHDITILHYSHHQQPHRGKSFLAKNRCWHART